MKQPQKQKPTLIDKIINSDVSTVSVYLVNGMFHGMMIQFEDVGEYLRIFYIDSETEEHCYAEYRKKCVLALFVWEYEHTQDIIISPSEIL